MDKFSRNLFVGFLQHIMCSNLEDIGTNYMSNARSGVLVLRGERLFRKFSNLRIYDFYSFYSVLLIFLARA